MRDAAFHEFLALPPVTERLIKSERLGLAIQAVFARPNGSLDVPHQRRPDAQAAGGFFYRHAGDFDYTTILQQHARGAQRGVALEREEMQCGGILLVAFHLGGHVLLPHENFGAYGKAGCKIRIAKGNLLDAQIRH